MRKIAILIYSLFSLSFFGFAQSPEMATIKSSMKGITDSLKYVDALNRLAMLMYEKNIDSTFYFTKQAREIAKRHRYIKGNADALNNLGIFFDIKGNLQLALRYYNEAYTGYNTIKDSANQVQTIMNIAMVYKEFGKDKRAVQWFNRAVKTGELLKHDSIMSLVLYNYVLGYPKNFTAKTRKNSINKAKQIALKYEDERTILAIDQLIADDLIVGGKHEAGFKLLGNTIDSAIRKKMFYVSMDMLIDMGDKLAEKAPLLSVARYREGLEIANRNGFLIYSQILARKIFDFYTRRGDDAQAVVYGRKLMDLQEQQAKIDNLSSIDYLDYALKEQQVTLLVGRSKYQVTLLIVVTIACLLALAVLVWIRKNLKHTKKLNKKITDQNNTLKEALQALEQSQADNTRMLKIVAHDLRSPIAAIHSLSTLMMDEAQRPDSDKQILKVIIGSSKDSHSLVNDLLQMQFKTEALTKTPVDLAELVQYCVLLLQNSADAKAQIINLRVKQVTLLASGEKLWRVMSNLIANAIKFSPYNATIEVEMEEEANSVRIGVADEGIGIPVEIEDKIFEMFTEAKRPGTAGEQPFGLGLAISKQIVEAHGGKIWFERKASKGTIFFIELPLFSN